MYTRINRVYWIKILKWLNYNMNQNRDVKIALNVKCCNFVEWRLNWVDLGWIIFLRKKVSNQFQ